MAKYGYCGVDSLLSKLFDFYNDYPASLVFGSKGEASTFLPPRLLKSIEQHREKQLEILNQSQVYVLDEPAQIMLHNIVAQMKRDALDSMFSNVRLPFPEMLLTASNPATDGWLAGLITQDDDNLYTQVFSGYETGLVPNFLIFRSRGAEITFEHTPSLGLFNAIGRNVSEQAAIEKEKPFLDFFLGRAVAISVLLEHKAMLETEERPAYTRAERRRAQKSGKALPNKTIVHVKLGELGKRQLEASKNPASNINENNTTTRRAHWVQGHAMRNRSGGISWRNPHMRGVGQVIEQERHISIKDS